MYQQPDPYRHAWPAEPAARRRPAMLAGLAALAVAAAVFGVASSGGGRIVAGSGSSVLVDPATDRQGSGNSGNSGNSRTPGAGPGSAGTATAAQQVGVVDINTVLKYQGAAAAGTGMVLASSGEILTNNHVVAGATRISVQVVTTGKTYRATVVGTDPTQDVAVLQLQDASGLQAIDVGDSDAVQVADAVTGVGNAGGSGGVPSAATGTVVALDQALTATDESGQSAEQLTGMIEANAPIEAGDSGGPLYDSAGHVIGMDTAASASGRRAFAAFAIPINRATAIAAEMMAGHASATIHLGYPGFLGISTAAGAGSPGALVESVLPDGPAAHTGLGAGDVITAVGGTAVSSSTALRTAVAAHKPGESVAVTWLDAAGQTHRAAVTLAVGPPD
jgi:S1-C subfamily serine protease